MGHAVLGFVVCISLFGGAVADNAKPSQYNPWNMNAMPMINPWALSLKPRSAYGMPQWQAHGGAGRPAAPAMNAAAPKEETFNFITQNIQTTGRQVHDMFSPPYSWMMQAGMDVYGLKHPWVFDYWNTPQTLASIAATVMEPSAEEKKEMLAKGEDPDSNPIKAGFNAAGAYLTGGDPVNAFMSSLKSSDPLRNVVGVATGRETPLDLMSTLMSGGGSKGVNPLSMLLGGLGGASNNNNNNNNIFNQHAMKASSNNQPTDNTPNPLSMIFGSGAANPLSMLFGTPSHNEAHTSISNKHASKPVSAPVTEQSTKSFAPVSSTPTIAQETAATATATTTSKDSTVQQASVAESKPQGTVPTTPKTEAPAAAATTTTAAANTPATLAVTEDATNRIAPATTTTSTPATETAATAKPATATQTTKDDSLAALAKATKPAVQSSDQDPLFSLARTLFGAPKSSKSRDSIPLSQIFEKAPATHNSDTDPLISMLMSGAKAALSGSSSSDPMAAMMQAMLSPSSSSKGNAANPFGAMLQNLLLPPSPSHNTPRSKAAVPTTDTKSISRNSKIAADPLTLMSRGLPASSPQTAAAATATSSLPVQSTAVSAAQPVAASVASVQSVPTLDLNSLKQALDTVSTTKKSALAPNADTLAASSTKIA